jgi:2-keto-4-pentenoate hydratase/2-oxohepta-3-ene-1,7-dioic acid hydratase in catechol pathway
VRLVSIDGRIRAVLPDGTHAVDLGDLTGLPAGACRFLGAGGLAAAADRLGDVSADAPSVTPLAGARLDPVIPKPRMVWAIGVNYGAHAAEMSRTTVSVPTVFVKSPMTLVGHGDDVIVPPHVTQPDYEGEVALVIARDCRDVPEAEALDVIAGVTVANDVSARDHQYVTSQFSWSKSFDTFCPLGPQLVTLDEVDPFDLRLETRVNGELRQEGTTADLLTSIPAIVAHLSQGCTLQAGDVILTGTPAGVGHGRTPPTYLQDGDVVEITIAGVGTLSNAVVRRG